MQGDQEAKALEVLDDDIVVVKSDEEDSNEHGKRRISSQSDQRRRRRRVEDDVIDLTNEETPPSQRQRNSVFPPLQFNNAFVLQPFTDFLNSRATMPGSFPRSVYRSPSPPLTVPPPARPNILRSLPLPAVDPEPADPARLKCVICLSTPDASTELSATVCGHIFCAECLRDSIKKTGKKCPICRKSLAAKNSVHRLYLSN
ncbi:hypothetical protein DFJ73DRAFT_135278 [Zopfochytrium polystomum]|nr:hypothetical protein DFJ73DRAFT_135278 [Zopfochytrium polystomum]